MPMPIGPMPIGPMPIGPRPRPMEVPIGMGMPKGPMPAMPIGPMPIGPMPIGPMPMPLKPGGMAWEDHTNWGPPTRHCPAPPAPSLAPV
jgi:hypothetical protein